MRRSILFFLFSFERDSSNCVIHKNSLISLQSFSSISRVFICIMLITASGFLPLNAQEPPFKNIPVTTPEEEKDSLDKSIAIIDNVSKNDTTVSEDAIEYPVEYQAEDSMVVDLTTEKVFLYGGAQVNYQQTQLNADYIELDLKNNHVSATGLPDSSGTIVGEPIFKDGEQEFQTEKMTYNFETQKGKISEVKTQEGEGFIKGNEVKKVEDKMFIHNGYYTTCNLERPHFSLATSKLKVIPKDKIVTGPVILKIGDVPTPLGLPFGIFSNKKGRSSGVLIPTYGDSRAQGFFLRNGGFYWGISDYVDARITGDIYSLGSWGLRAASSYRKRYKYKGSASLSYSKIKNGFEELPSFSESDEFFVKWRHNQDRKARPGSSFSANVNAGSRRNFERNLNSFNQDFLTNTFQSSITYSNAFPNKPYNLNVSARHNQNTRTGALNLSLPEVSFNVTRQQPFKSAGKIGNEWWRGIYKNFGISYAASASNQLRTYDSLFTFDRIREDFQTGLSHSVPISTSFKLLKYLNVNPSFNYAEVWAIETTRRQVDPDSNVVVDDVISGFERGASYNFNTALTTKFYSLYQYKRGAVKAIRHVMTPSISFNYQPEITTGLESYLDTLGNEIEYSIFEGGLNGRPDRQESGRIGFNLINNIEMKVKSKKDTSGLRKVKLLENLGFNTSYDVIADSLNWSPVSFNGRTRIGKLLNFQFNGNLDPYAIDSSGRRINTFQSDVEGKLFRLTAASAAVNFSLKGGKGDNKGNKKSKFGTDDELEEINAYPERYVDFNIPWSLNVSYNIRYSKPSFEAITTQTLNFNGDLNLTENWKVGFNSGWNFEQKDFAYTSININRNLHCWQLAINWIPIGIRQSYNITLNVKASVLQDLKLNRRRDFFDVIQ